MPCVSNTHLGKRATLTSLFGQSAVDVLKYARICVLTQAHFHSPCNDM